MGLVTLPQFLIILAVVAVIIGSKRLGGSDDGSLPSRLRHELRGRMPVYSAETTSGREAEFIRERLPKRFPASVRLVLVLLFGAAAWWLTR
jgi:hypothetical protein